MGSLRVAVALPHLGVYGGIRRFFELGEVWSGQGHTVALFTPPTGGGEPSPRWLPFRGEISSLDRMTGRSWDVLLSPDPDLFLRVEVPGALRVFYAVLEKAPRAREAWESAALVLANSTGMTRHLARHGIPAANGIGGVNVRFFSPPPAGERDGRTGPVRLLVYGRLSRRRKGTLTAAHAVETAARITGAEVELTLFDAPPPGADEDPDALRLAVPHRWVLHPSQERLAALYRDADIFVSAERRAGWCNTAAEAMASGTCVVCTPSGTEDFARHEETALVARWSWTWPIARHIARLLRDPAARRRIAPAGTAAIQAFSWERTAARIEAAVTARLGGTHAPLEAEATSA